MGVDNEDCLCAFLDGFSLWQGSECTRGKSNDADNTSFAATNRS